MPTPPRPSASHPPLDRSATGYEVLRVRVLMKLNDRLDPGQSRMPRSLFQQSARQHIEQVIDAEAPRLSRSDRARLAEEVFQEAFGCGPLEELFPDQTVKEILVLGPQAVVVRQEHHGWTPTNVKFRDAEHLHEVIQRASVLGEPVGGRLSHSAIDVLLPSGFRLVAVIPPPVLDQPTNVVLIRTETEAPLQGDTGTHPALQPGTGTHPALPTAGKSRSATTPPAVGSPLASPVPGEQQFARHRARITQRLITKMARLGVYDLDRLEISELRRVVAAYVEEYCRTEKIYLSDTDQGRLTLEILTGMNR
ncbi:MAG TPA: hypothetical protein VKE74_14035 [Gemmataceae bacterium]|nr:hypothetical protein [Gemmataceae bacterium]